LIENYRLEFIEGNKIINVMFYITTLTTVYRNKMSYELY